ncbi:MAG TPA: cytochrome c oxidase subunit II [Gaiellaceae bacterium]
MDRRTIRALPVSVLVAVLAGCGGNQNALDPHSSSEGKIADLWWVMLGAACVGFGVVVALLFAGWLRRDRAFEGEGAERRATTAVVVLGVAIPIVVLTALFVWADVFVDRSTAAPPAGRAQLTVRVIAHQWWWEVRYPGTAAVTADEIHVPVGKRVDIVATSADVIHSFWVPELNRKIDLIPGRTASVLIDADRPGRYRGQCSEFCGVQHAHMTVEVVAQMPGAFHAWLAGMEKPAAAPVTTAESDGRTLFLGSSCASCHSIRGTSAAGRVGPDLTHLATRATLAALTIPNRPDYLRGWIADPQRVKPGATMPAIPLTSRELSALVAYLDHLR